MLGLTLHACVHSLAWQRLGWRDVLPVGWVSIFARRGAYRGCGRAVPVLALTLVSNTVARSTDEKTARSLG
jgi:hypothetical protein